MHAVFLGVALAAVSSVPADEVEVTVTVYRGNPDAGEAGRTVVAKLDRERTRYGQPAGTYSTGISLKGTSSVLGLPVGLRLARYQHFIRALPSPVRSGARVELDVRLTESLSGESSEDTTRAVVVVKPCESFRASSSMKDGVTTWTEVVVRPVAAKD